ncbi:MAG: type II secretion system GspH family protein [Deltaproteobacteria bacterium]|nr:type II secretion system GspH family protein [Deltaproteobacteria bacterium]
MRVFFKSKKGLTLVELAIVLVIVGILLSVGMSLMGPLTKRAKYMDSKEVVRGAKEALVGYLMKNGYLPNSLSQLGVRTQDAWLRDLVYISATGLNSSGQDVCSYNGPFINLHICRDTACTTFDTKTDIVFIVYSKGEDADGGCTDTGTGYYVREAGMPYVLPCTYNATSPQFNYDDIVEYVSLYELISKRCVYTVSSVTDLCSGGPCLNGCSISFRNDSPSTVWIKGGLISCQTVPSGGQISLGSMNADQIIYVYTNPQCATPVSILKLGTSIKSPSIIYWTSPGSATCN